MVELLQEERKEQNNITNDVCVNKNLTDYQNFSSENKKMCSEASFEI